MCIAVLDKIDHCNESLSLILLKQVQTRGQSRGQSAHTNDNSLFKSVATTGNRRLVAGL